MLYVSVPVVHAIYSKQVLDLGIVHAHDHK